MVTSKIRKILFQTKTQIMTRAQARDNIEKLQLLRTRGNLKNDLQFAWKSRLELLKGKEDEHDATEFVAISQELSELQDEIAIIKGKLTENENSLRSRPDFQEADLGNDIELDTPPGSD